MPVTPTAVTADGTDETEMVHAVDVVVVVDDGVVSLFVQPAAANAMAVAETRNRGRRFISPIV